MRGVGGGDAFSFVSLACGVGGKHREEGGGVRKELEVGCAGG